jgi:hypothetical protein
MANGVLFSSTGNELSGTKSIRKSLSSLTHKTSLTTLVMLDPFGAQQYLDIAGILKSIFGFQEYLENSGT